MVKSGTGLQKFSFGGWDVDFFDLAALI